MLTAARLRATGSRAVEARRVLAEGGKAEEEAMPVLHGRRRQRRQPKCQGAPQPRQPYCRSLLIRGA
ncbi:hypothetical protein Vlu01_23070 [Micromonospora lutea]|uniref:Uncharacterized protein n=1 Tax=Micromonospora lutea TaxID=419825 RepID=A0ABQ4IUT5_9ACTN|nr:hypothetical protein Vlu01_23070 [Micromonospora lutea]